jgi:hypothetical protein
MGHDVPQGVAGQSAEAKRIVRVVLRFALGVLKSPHHAFARAASSICYRAKSALGLLVREENCQFRKGAHWRLAKSYAISAMVLAKTSATPNFRAIKMALAISSPLFTGGLFSCGTFKPSKTGRAPQRDDRLVMKLILKNKHSACE